MKHTLLGLGLVVVILVLVTTLLVLFNRPILATAIGAFAIASFILLLVLGAFAIGAYWERQGGRYWIDMALRSQESDDRRDVAQIKAAGDLAKILMKQREQQPAMPLLPSQQTSWLPALEEWEEVDKTERR